MQVLYSLQFLLLLEFFNLADSARPNHRGKKEITLKTKRLNRMAVLVLPKIEGMNKKGPDPPALPTTKLTSKKSKHKKNQSESQEPPIKIEVIHIYHYPTQDNIMTTTSRVDIIDPGKNAGKKAHFKPSKGSRKPKSFQDRLGRKALSGNKDSRLLPPTNSITSSEAENQEEGEEEEEEPLVMKKEAVRRPVPSFYLNGKPCLKAEISYCWDDGSCAWWQICKTFNCITDCYIRYGDEWRWR